MARGPAVFLWFFQEAGGFLETTKLMRTSKADLNMMLSSAKKIVSGIARTEQPDAWWGYPKPFPGLDELTRKLTGTDFGFIPYLCQTRKLRYVMGQIKSRPFSVEQIDRRYRPWREEDWQKVLDACFTTGVTRWHQKSWLRGSVYPARLRKLDRLVSVIGFKSWIEAVLSLDTRRLRHRADPEAICTLIESSGAAIVGQSLAGYGLAHPR